ncbi:MAG: S8 family peptidase, partial [Actinomycetota bacterium]|nr:S8 family peptidase [Actinomycetota bacterium]
FLMLALVATTTLLAAGVAFTQVPDNRDSNRYIVVLDDGVESPSQVASGIGQRQNLKVGFVYSHALKGFSALIPNERVAAVRADERVKYLEPDTTMHAVAQTLPWGINRVDADKSSTRAGNGSGSVSNVNAYIIDSGIYRHTDLNVIKHVNFTGGKNTDCFGHGTHVAGTVAAKDNATAVVGVAPGAPLTGVKVLGCNGGGSASTIVAGIDWVTANAKKPAVANISISGGANTAIDDAVRKSADSGVFYSIAAGNNGANACNYSPARAGAGTNNGIATVGATNTSDGATSSSNYGACVDIWAPGARILSTRKGGGTTTKSGTSMASPHVGGGGALYLSSHTSASPTTVESKLTSSATTTGTKNNYPILREYVGGF